jgi:hypothetical protein
MTLRFNDFRKQKPQASYKTDLGNNISHEKQETSAFPYL